MVPQILMSITSTGLRLTALLLFSLPVFMPRLQAQQESKPRSLAQTAVPAVPAAAESTADLESVSDAVPGGLNHKIHPNSHGCVRCHRNTHDPHGSAALSIGCTDCHGGNPDAFTERAAHVQPRFASVFSTSANPVRSYTVLNHENPEFIRFMNPGDLRVAKQSCGTANCHPRETLAVSKSMMTHGCMLWGAALYNNGSVPDKWARYGESYSMHGTPQRLLTVPPPTEEEIREQGILPALEPLPRFQVTQPGNILRIFEPGGRFVPDIGIPERLELAGKPLTRLSNRGLGTGNRTDPVFIGLQKTRLLDPTLNFLGTNDHPGDYRSSGCTACHMVYANDSSPVNSGPFAKYGNRGLAGANPDPTIPHNEPGHPIAHRFTSGIPSSQCIVCHIHPGTTVMNSYLGYMWWDLETHADLMYREPGRQPSREEIVQNQLANPEASSSRGKWSDREFLENLTQLNPRMDQTQMASFSGHGWAFSAVFRKDRHGQLIDLADAPISDVTPELLMQSVQKPERITDLYRNLDWNNSRDRATFLEQRENLEQAHLGVPVHQLDVHLERGMHCVDCHFQNDVHGNTKLYGEVRAAIEIRCIDCHGTIQQRAIDTAGKMLTSGPASRANTPQGQSGMDLTQLRTPFGKPRFEVSAERIVQNSMVDPELSWEVSQLVDVINPSNSEKYNPLAALAKTIRVDRELGRFLWGDVPPQGDAECAHTGSNMSCIACHSSWNPSCYGCHLPQEANRKMPELHNAGDISRNYTSYNFQTLRDEVFMLARDGDVTGNCINPARSSCAIHVTSYNANRESIYVQQQTVSAEGLSGIAFSTNVPHTVRGKQETKRCTDCHLSTADDNNAIMAQLLMQGTNYLNFIGKYCWVAAGEDGLLAVQVTESEEPQAVIGSYLHSEAFPAEYAQHRQQELELQTAYEHPGRDIGDELLNPLQKSEVLSIQARGEYLYAACGTGGIRVFDIAFIDHKGFSERIRTAPASPLGQRFYARTPHATDVAAPATIAPDPTRNADRSDRTQNHESAIDPIYAWLFATDLELGLVLIPAGTLLDGNPINNFIEPALTYNPQNKLRGARRITIVGEYAWICCDAGLVVVDLSTPLKPQITEVLELDGVSDVQAQFRAAFALAGNKLITLDCTDPAHPQLTNSEPLQLPGEPHRLYVARTYAYVASGSAGLVIVDVETPHQPQIDQVFNADGSINDLQDVKLGITYVSEFAYLADGRNGLRVVQLTSPQTPGNKGFSPRPTPRLISTWPVAEGGRALAVAEGIDRDRAVDESGNQIAVFGRVGARPLSLQEQQRLYLMEGQPYRLQDPLRDYTDSSPRRREILLHQQIEQLYGPSRHASLNSLQRTPSSRLLPLPRSPEQKETPSGSADGTGVGLISQERTTDEP